MQSGQAMAYTAPPNIILQDVTSKLALTPKLAYELYVSHYADQRSSSPERGDWPLLRRIRRRKAWKSARPRRSSKN